MMRESHLTAKQRAFVSEYIVDKNATQAAIRAGYSEKTAHVIGHENLKKPNVQTAIAEARQHRQERTRVTADQTVREMARLAFVDPRRLVNEDGSFKGLHELDDDMAAAVSSVEVDEYGRVKFKLWNKNAALDKLFKHLGLYEKDNHQKPVTVAEIRLVTLRQLAAELTGNSVRPNSTIDWEAEND